MQRSASEDGELHHAAGLEHLRNGDYERALRHFRHAFRLDPSCDDHYEAVAFCEEQLRQEKRKDQLRPQLSSWLKARLRASTASHPSASRRSASEERREAEAAIREAAAQEQNREAAAAFFEKAREAVEADDFVTALRRIRRATELHPLHTRRSSRHGGGGRAPTAEEQEAAATYREWHEALERAVARQQQGDGADGVGYGHTDGQAADAAAEATAARQRRAQQRAARAQREAEQEAEVARRERARDEQARARREAEEAKARARREAEEQKQRARAQARANVEAAEACLAKARVAKDADSTVRLLRRAVTLRRCHLRSRALLLRALVWQLCRSSTLALGGWWAARGGLRGYLRAGLTIVGMALLLWLGTQWLIGRLLRAADCAPLAATASHGVRGTAHTASAFEGTIPSATAGDGGRTRPPRLRCMVGGHLSWATTIARDGLMAQGTGGALGWLPRPAILGLLALPALLMVLLSAEHFLQLATGPWPAAWRCVRVAIGWLSDFVSAVFDLLCKWFENLQRSLEEWEEETERGKEQRYRQQQQQQQQRQSHHHHQQQYRSHQHPRQQQQQHHGTRARRPHETGDPYWEYEQKQRQHSWRQWQEEQEWQRQQQQRQRQQQYGARAQANQTEAALRDRARQLPSSDARRTALLARTHYEALGISRGASAAEAKKAFHRLALQLHPDKNKQPLAEEAFKRVEEAHRTLADKRLRAEYDLTLPAASQHPKGSKWQ